MNETGNEVEVKFLIENPGDLIDMLKSSGAVLIQPRVHEFNLRFDTADGALTKEHRVLRLRKDQKIHLTYKAPALPDQQVSIRREIEFEVSNFDDARQLLEALDYHVSISYEKYRQTYAFENCQIMIDEMPFGNFLEIEGSNAEAIESVATGLGLIWGLRCLESYMALFNRLKMHHGIEVANLTFAELEGLGIKATDVGLLPADQRLR